MRVRQNCVGDWVTRLTKKLLTVALGLNLGLPIATNDFPAFAQERAAESIDRPDRAATRQDSGRNEGRLLGLLLLVVVALDWFVLRRAGGRS